MSREASVFSKCDILAVQQIKITYHRNTTFRSYYEFPINKHNIKKTANSILLKKINIMENSHWKNALTSDSTSIRNHCKNNLLMYSNQLMTSDKSSTSETMYLRLISFNWYFHNAQNVVQCWRLTQFLWNIFNYDIDPYIFSEFRIHMSKIN